MPRHKTAEAKVDSEAPRYTSLVLLASPEFGRWAREFIASQRDKTTTLLEKALVHYAASCGYPAPPSSRLM
jgi:hypothetical protein